MIEEREGNVLTDLLHESLTERTSLIIQLKNKKQAKQLKKYGDLHYVSKRMNYAVLYVDQTEAEHKKSKLEEENYVKKVSISPKGTFPLEYDGLLAEMQKEINVDKKGKDSIFDL